MPYSDYPPGTIAARGKEIYSQRVQHKVEPQHKGKIVAIDIQTGDYEIGDNDLKAIKHLLAKRPESIIYSLRIGVGQSMELVLTLRQTRHDHRKSYRHSRCCH